MLAETIEDAVWLHERNEKYGNQKQLGGFNHIVAELPDGSMVDNNPARSAETKFFPEEEVLQSRKP